MSSLAGGMTQRHTASFAEVAEAATTSFTGRGPDNGGCPAAQSP